MSKEYQNWASEVAYFIDFDFAIFAMFKTLVLLICILHEVEFKK